MLLRKGASVSNSVLAVSVDVNNVRNIECRVCLVRLGRAKFKRATVLISFKLGTGSKIKHLLCLCDVGVVQSGFSHYH